jgi:hypothetical protein
MGRGGGGEGREGGRERGREGGSTFSVFSNRVFSCEDGKDAGLRDMSDATGRFS